MKMFLSRRTASNLLIGFLFLVGIINIYAAPGDLDPTFNAVVPGLNNGVISVIEKQPDGKFLLGGTFQDINGHATTALARLNADGTIDTTFSSPDFGNGTGVGGAIQAIGVQSDGKIVVGGNIYGVNGVFGKKIYRLNPNGSLDTTFQAPAFETFTGEGVVNAIKIQADDKIVAGGDFGIGAEGASNKLVRLNADGTVDNAFANFTTVGIIYSLEIQPDGRILTGGTSLVRRHMDGSNDQSFSGVSTSGFGSIFAIELSPDGKIFIGGQFSNLNGTTIRNLAKVNSDGSLDLNFNLNGLGPNDFVSSILALKDGKIIISGYFTTYNATAQQKIARLNFDGSRDSSFQSNPAFSGFFSKDAELFDDGEILLGGSIQSNAPISPLVRLNTDGSLDTSLEYVVSYNGRVREICRQPDGKILIVGQFSAVNGVRRSSVARLNADGSLDPTFVPYFNNSAPPILYSIALLADGKIVVGGGSGIFRKMNPDGSQDTAFNSPLGVSSRVFDIEITQSGQLIVGGDLTYPNSQVRRIIRTSANGVNDTLFAAEQPNGAISDLQIQPDGKIIIGGTFTQIGSSLRGNFARLTSEGALDPTFNPPGGAGGGGVSQVELQPDGKILLGGSFTSLNASTNQVRIGRVNADGTLDASFVQSVDNSVNTIKLQPDGKILIGGIFTAVAGVPKVSIAKLNASGSLDVSFNASVPNGISDIQLQEDGKILIGGDFVKVNGMSKIRIARLLNAGAVPTRTPFDYDGDNKADISVFRPSENKWYILQSSNYALRENVFGLAGDVPVPADYDGDLKTDIAIYRPSTGTWWYLSSISGAQIAVVFGLPDGIPRPSDIDGDGKTDFVFYRPADSKWYRMTATGVVAPQFAFGIAEDKPLIGDFDGDGKSEPAIFRPSTGDWWYAPSSATDGHFAVVHWGASGDVPVPADVDADGKTDFVVYRPSNGGWYILRSGEQNYTILQFGTAEDKPVMADYDGDGKADVGVFRPSSGTWYLLQTTSGFGAVQWGSSLDIPTENSFLP